MTAAESGIEDRVTQRSKIVLAVGLMAFSLLSVKAVAETESVTTMDPLLGDVIRMLEVGIESDMIVRWIETGDRRPGVIAADDLIALNRAGASKELMGTLMDRLAVEAAPAGATAAGPPGDMEPDGAAVVARPAAARPSTPQTAVRAKPEVSPSGENCCLVEFAVEYRAAEDREGEELPQPGRDLFLYIDGQYLARFESQGSIASRGPVRFKVKLPTGDHVLRFTRELHTPAKGTGSPGTWAHETTVSPSIIPLAVAPGSDWQLDLRWVQSEFSTAHPLTWSWIENGVKVAGAAKTGAFREQWPYLCEDAEISSDSGTMANWRVRDRLKSCVRWASLWPGSAQNTRAQLLEELGRVDFKPVVGSRVSIQ